MPLNPDEIDSFTAAAYGFASASLPADPATLALAKTTIQECLNNCGYTDDIQAYAYRGQDKTFLGRLFFENVLSGIVISTTQLIDKEKLENNLKKYKAVIDKATKDARTAHGSRANLDYVALCNLGLKIPANYELTESDIAYVLKQASGGKKFPIHVKDNTYITEVAELSNADPDAPTLKKILTEFADKHDDNYIAYIPLNLGSFHWIYLVVEIEDGEWQEFNIVDSLDPDDSAKERLKTSIHNEIKDIFDGVLKDNINIDCKIKQTDSSTCGFRMVQGILNDTYKDHPICKKKGTDVLREAVFDTIRKQAKKDGKLKADASSTHGHGMFDKKRKSSKGNESEIRIINDVMKANIKKLLADKDLFKTKSKLDKWPVIAECKVSNSSTETYELKIDEVKSSSGDYLSMIAETDELEILKSVIDNAAKLGAKSIDIRVKDASNRSDLLQYCKDRYPVLTVENASKTFGK